MKHKILVATTNRAKMTELVALVGDVHTDIQWLGLADFSNVASVAEDGASFAENARKKAVGYAEQTRCWTIADDSGLVVDALDGRPGIMSARFSGKVVGENEDREIIDRANIARVLELMQAVPAEKRTARFICSLCVASPQKILIETKGVVEGLIAGKAVGTNGFGYDPIFFLPNPGKTAAQLTSEEKNAVSHRGSAIRKLRPLLIELLCEQGEM